MEPNSGVNGRFGLVAKVELASSQFAGLHYLPLSSAFNLGSLPLRSSAPPPPIFYVRRRREQTAEVQGA
jgi:hypothetical protein